MNTDGSELLRRQRQQAKRTAALLALLALGIYAAAFLKYAL